MVDEYDSVFRFTDIYMKKTGNFLFPSKSHPHADNMIIFLLRKRQVFACDLFIMLFQEKKK